MVCRFFAPLDFAAAASGGSRLPPGNQKRRMGQRRYGLSKVRIVFPHLAKRDNSDRQDAERGKAWLRLWCRGFPGFVKDATARSASSLWSRATGECQSWSRRSSETFLWTVNTNETSKINEWPPSNSLFVRLKRKQGLMAHGLKYFSPNIQSSSGRPHHHAEHSLQICLRSRGGASGEPSPVYLALRGRDSLAPAAV
jgi:hypothetical protein